MKVTLKAFANIGELLGTPEVEVELPPGATIQTLLDEVARRHPKLRGRVLDDRGCLCPAVNVMLNGEDTQYQKGLDTPLGDGDEVAVFPPVAGG